MGTDIFRSVTLEITAGLPSQFPSDGLFEAALSGRSNVGKSSLINTVTGRKSLARTSSAPGKTVTVNFYNIGGKLRIADLPGYGYARRSAESKRVWSELTDFYIRKHTPDFIVQLIDLKAGATADDELMLAWIRENGIGCVIAATKCDKLNKTERAAQLEKLEKNPLISRGMDRISVIPFSSLTGEGRYELISAILASYDGRRKKQNG